MGRTKCRERSLYDIELVLCIPGDNLVVVSP